MTNQEKYKDKTPFELQKLFDEFCEKNEECCNCEIYQNTYRHTDCVFQWLNMQDEEASNENP